MRCRKQRGNNRILKCKRTTSLRQYFLFLYFFVVILSFFLLFYSGVLCYLTSSPSSSPPIHNKQVNNLQKVSTPHRAFLPLLYPSLFLMFFLPQHKHTHVHARGSNNSNKKRSARDQHTIINKIVPRIFGDLDRPSWKVGLA